MSVVTLTVQVIALTGTTPTYAAANDVGGNDFVNDGRTFLQVKNSGASTTVTVDSPTLCDQGEAHDVTVTVATSGDKMIGPFNPKRFNSSAGKVTATYSQVTGITVAAIQFVNTG